MRILGMGMIFLYGIVFLGAHCGNPPIRTAGELQREQACIANVEQGDLTAAETNCELCIEYNERNAECLNGLGLVWYQRGDDLRAREYYIKASRENNDFAQPRNNIGVIEFENGHFQQAIEYFLSAVEIDPAFRDGRYNVALSFLRLAQQTVANQHDPQKYLNESESHYRRLIELYPQHAQAFHDLGVVLSMRAEYVAKTENLKRQLLQDSEVFFVRCLELKPSTQILEVCHGNLAHLYAMTGRFDEATYHGVQCLAYNPRNAVCATELKSTYAGSQMRSESLRIFMERIVENPDYAPGHTTFCLALFQRNLSTMAVQECEHAIRLDAQQCEAHFALANHFKTVLDAGMAHHHCTQYQLCQGKKSAQQLQQCGEILQSTTQSP